MTRLMVVEELPLLAPIMTPEAQKALKLKAKAIPAPEVRSRQIYAVGATIMLTKDTS